MHLWVEQQEMSMSYTYENLAKSCFANAKQDTFQSCKIYFQEHKFSYILCLFRGYSFMSGISFVSQKQTVEDL